MYAYVAKRGVRARAYLTTYQSVTASTATRVRYSGENFDSGSHYENSVTQRFTADTVMSVLVNAVITCEAYGTWTAGATIRLSIYKNGTAVTHNTFYVPAAGITHKVVSISDYLSLTADDYVEVYVYASQQITLQTGIYASYVTFTMI